jgi:hypothetical protein
MDESLLEMLESVQTERGAMTRMEEYCITKQGETSSHKDHALFAYCIVL